MFHVRPVCDEHDGHGLFSIGTEFALCPHRDRRIKCRHQRCGPRLCCREWCVPTLTTSHAFKGTGSNVTESILCPNVNGSSSPTIVLTFNVSGLPESMSYNNVGLDIHALNGSGSYQQNGDNKKRFFNMAISQGATQRAHQ